MVRDVERWRRFEDEFLRSTRTGFTENLAVFEALWKYATQLGALPPDNALEGIAVDVRLARVLNVPGTPPERRTRP